MFSLRLLTFLVDDVLYDLIIIFVAGTFTEKRTRNFVSHSLVVFEDFANLATYLILFLKHYRQAVNDVALNYNFLPSAAGIRNRCSGRKGLSQRLGHVLELQIWVKSKCGL